MVWRSKLRPAQFEGQSVRWSVSFDVDAVSQSAVSAGSPPCLDEKDLTNPYHRRRQRGGGKERGREEGATEPQPESSAIAQSRKRRQVIGLCRTLARVL